MATDNSTETERAKLLEAASGDLSKTHALLCSCRRMTDPLDAESLQIDQMVQMALGSLSQAIERVAFCNDDLGGVS